MPSPTTMRTMLVQVAQRMRIPDFIRSLTDFLIWLQDRPLQARARVPPVQPPPPSQSWLCRSIEHDRVERGQLLNRLWQSLPGRSDVADPEASVFVFALSPEIGYSIWRRLLRGSTEDRAMGGR